MIQALTPGLADMALNARECLRNRVVGVKGSAVSFHYASLISEADRGSETRLMSSMGLFL